MDNFTISIFANKIFFEIMKEIKLFSKFKLKHYEDLDLCLKDAEKESQLIVFFDQSLCNTKIKNFPSILISKESQPKNKTSDILQENIKMPFKILEFKKTSLINLSDYVIDKNERKIKKNNLELQLTEKEINFLILFSEDKEPLSRNFILKNIWH